jgi:RES domain-containing protein
LLHLFRICRNIYDPSDPAGAVKTPGRWHISGESVLYFCSSLAMCILELKANSIPFSTIREVYHFIDLEVQDDPDIFEEVPESFYSKNWSLNRSLTRDYGDKWYRKGKYPFLKVMSAVLPTDSNFILNTRHALFSGLKFPKPLPIPLDPRIK